MDLFRFNNSSTFTSGESIDEWDSASWTERYRDPGEFEIKAKLSSGLRDFLPLGTLISHHKTLEVMVVENHQIAEDVDSDPLLTITGRSLQTLLESRIVGQNNNWASPPASISVSLYTLPANYTWIQGTTLINDHIRVGTVINAGDGIPSLVGANDVSGTGVSEARTVKRNNVMKELVDILEVNDLGLRGIRPHNVAGLPQPGANATLLIHDGDDRRSQVVFSTKNGDIDSADYLWSIKKLKTSALVSGRYVEQMVHGPETGLDRRVMLVDGSDIDGVYDVIPTGATLTSVRTAMTTRGNQALQAQKRLQLSRTDISRTPTYSYRRDYNMGDIVSVDSSYGPISTMRVVEYVEIVDETGESSHPTLEILGS